MFFGVGCGPILKWTFGGGPCFLKTAPPRLKLHEMLDFKRLGPREMAAQTFTKSPK